MHDMLRIMDVASALRRGREAAESQLDVSVARHRLRERLMATAAAAGEAVTAAEVDAAIEHYFAGQHRYADPPRGWRRFAAHVWVMRGSLGVALLCLGVLGGTVALAMGAATGTSEPKASPASAIAPAPVPTSTPTPTPVPQLPAVETETPPSAPAPAPITNPTPVVDMWREEWQKWETALAAARKLATAPDGLAAVEQVVPGAEAAAAQKDTARLRGAQRLLAEVVARLDEEYIVTLVSRDGENSVVAPMLRGKVSGYFAIVEARTVDGRALPRDILHTEDKQRHRVSIWGEEVPEDVFERLVADKQQDGVLDESVFARKVRGTSGPVIEMRDGAGRVLLRGRTITRW